MRACGGWERRAGHACAGLEPGRAGTRWPAGRTEAHRDQGSEGPLGFLCGSQALREGVPPQRLPLLLASWKPGAMGQGAGALVGLGS